MLARQLLLSLHDTIGNHPLPGIRYPAKIRLITNLKIEVIVTVHLAHNSAYNLPLNLQEPQLRIHTQKLVRWDIPETLNIILGIHW